jgi:two-component system KDP operon response regulator KdpE
MAVVLLTGPTRPWARSLSPRLRAGGHQVDLTGPSTPDVAVLTCADAITGEADLRRLRKHVTAPVVVAVEAADFLDRVALYNAGAADCLTDQSVTDHLAESIGVLTGWLRHPAWTAAGAIATDLHRRGIPLPPIQRRLLAALLSQPGHPLPRPTLLTQVWGNHRTREEPILRLHLGLLRRRLSTIEGWWLLAQPASYQLVPPPTR